MDVKVVNNEDLPLGVLERAEYGKYRPVYEAIKKLKPGQSVVCKTDRAKTAYKSIRSFMDRVAKKRGWKFKMRIRGNTIYIIKEEGE